MTSSGACVNSEHQWAVPIPSGVYRPWPPWQEQSGRLLLLPDASALQVSSSSPMFLLPSTSISRIPPLEDVASFASQRPDDTHLPIERFRKDHPPAATSLSSASAQGLNAIRSAADSPEWGAIDVLMLNFRFRVFSDSRANLCVRSCGDRRVWRISVSVLYCCNQKGLREREPKSQP
ncbi:hypothetical protein VNO77_33864 [Canavalia gladiata]|uniref:Uncharacterized protein n=1 Tax=Canavalia gladiata TaxID=3824 RepID=A0AAN9KGI1_CANGL